MRPMKSGAHKHMVKVFQNVYNYLRERNLSLNLHVMDNECSRAIQAFIKKEKANIQLVEPHNHRVNAAKPAIKAVKYPTIAALSTVNPTCPLQLRDESPPTSKTH